MASTIGVNATPVFNAEAHRQVNITQALKAAALQLSLGNTEITLPEDTVALIGGNGMAEFLTRLRYEPSHLTSQHVANGV